MRNVNPVALYLARNLVVGGAERVVVNLANHARAVSPVVALLERSGGLVRELHPGVPCFARTTRERAPSETIVTESRVPGASLARLASECRWLRRVADETGAQVVSSFLMRAHVVALLTKMLFAPHLRVVLNIHEHLSESAEHFYPRAADRALMRLVARRLFRRADRIVVVARELERDLVANFGVPARLIDVAYNGHDLTQIRASAREPVDLCWPPSTTDHAGATRIIVAVGRLVHLKGYDLLLRALAKLRSTWDARLVLVGDGEDRASLEHLAVQLNVRDAVLFAGQQLDPWRWMARADVLALTSRTEAFPSVLVEAMAVGVPILATDSSAGVSECLLDGACGLIVPPNDCDAIATGIDRLFRDGHLRASLVATASARADAFDLVSAQQVYERILTDLIESRTS